MSVHSMKDMKGHDVIGLDSAESIGKVKHFVVSPDASRIERLHVDGRGKRAHFTEWADLESFGDDKVVVRHSDAAAESDDDRDIDTAKGDVDLLGSRILDTAGFEHGKVDDVQFDGDTGAIVAVISSDDVIIASEHVHSLGSYAVVVNA